MLVKTKYNKNNIIVKIISIIFLLLTFPSLLTAKSILDKKYDIVSPDLPGTLKYNCPPYHVSNPMSVLDLEMDNHGICKIPNNFAKLSEWNKVAVIKAVINSLERRIKLIIGRNSALKKGFFDKEEEVRCGIVYCVQVDNSKAKKITQINWEDKYDYRIKTYYNGKLTVDKKYQYTRSLGIHDLESDIRDLLIGEGSILNVIYIDSFGENTEVYIDKIYKI